MSMHSGQLRALIIRPTLEYLDLWSAPAEELLIGTAAHESQLGRYLHQLNDGPAVGIYQMEPATENDIWQNFLNFRQPLAEKVRTLLGGYPSERAVQMAGNLYYATAMARIKYLRAPGAIPADLEGQALYWKEHYNTAQGAGTAGQYLDDYRRYV